MPPSRGSDPTSKQNPNAEMVADVRNRKGIPAQSHTHDRAHAHTSIHTRSRSCTQTHTDTHRLPVPRAGLRSLATARAAGARPAPNCAHHFAAMLTSAVPLPVCLATFVHGPGQKHALSANWYRSPSQQALLVALASQHVARVDDITTWRPPQDVSREWNTIPDHLSWLTTQPSSSIRQTIRPTRVLAWPHCLVLLNQRHWLWVTLQVNHRTKSAQPGRHLRQLHRRARKLVTWLSRRLPERSR